MLLYAGDEHADGIAVPPDPGPADEACAEPWLSGLAGQVRHLTGGPAAADQQRHHGAAGN